MLVLEDECNVDYFAAVWRVWIFGIVEANQRLPSARATLNFVVWGSLVVLGNNHCCACLFWMSPQPTSGRLHQDLAR